LVLFSSEEIVAVFFQSSRSRSPTTTAPSCSFSALARWCYYRPVYCRAAWSSACGGVVSEWRSELTCNWRATKLGSWRWWVWCILLDVSAGLGLLDAANRLPPLYTSGGRRLVHWPRGCWLWPDGIDDLRSVFTLLRRLAVADVEYNRPWWLDRMHATVYST